MRKSRCKKRQGKITLNGVKLESHEMDTVLYFTKLGNDIELIPISHTPKDRRPDFVMNGLEWEVKSPTRGICRTVERAFYEASNQSSNIIMDLRRIAGDVGAIILRLEKYFQATRKVRRMYIIARNQELKFYRK